MGWQLQEAKQRFSELVRRAGREGLQAVTGAGQDVGGRGDTRGGVPAH